MEKISITQQIQILEFLKRYEIPENALLNALKVSRIGNIDKRQFNNLAIMLMQIEK